MILTYINPLNKNHMGEFLYEFIFSKDEKIDFGDDWDVTPASSGQPTPPPLNNIQMVGLLKSEEIELELAIYSDTFSLYDCAENILAMGWEKESPESEVRMVFSFGETFDSVKDKLYNRDLQLEIIKK